MNEAQESQGGQPRRVAHDHHRHACQDEEVDLVSNCGLEDPESAVEDSGPRVTDHGQMRKRFDDYEDSDAGLKTRGQTDPVEGARSLIKAGMRTLKSDPRNPRNDLEASLQRSRLSALNRTAPASTGKSSKGKQSRKSDPTDVHHEYDSIMESEGFSIVSLSSIPSAQNNISGVNRTGSSIADRNGVNGKSGSMDGTTSERGIKASVRPSSIPQTLSTLHPHTAPLLSPPLSDNVPRSNSSQATGEPVEAAAKYPRLERAGLALQDVLEPSQEEVRDNPSSQAPTSRLVNADGRPYDRFSGFGNRTRRELRAGLRLGEELAKRQQQQIAAHHSNLTPEVSTDSAKSDTENEVHYPELRHASIAMASSKAGPTARDMKLRSSRVGQANTNDGKSANASESAQVGRSKSNAQPISDDESESGDDTQDELGNVEESVETVDDDEATGGLMDETDIWQAEAAALSRGANDIEEPSGIPAPKSTRGRIPTPWKKGAKSGRKTGSTSAGGGTEPDAQAGKKRPSPTFASQPRKSRKRSPSSSPSDTSRSSDEIESEDGIAEPKTHDHEGGEGETSDDRESEDDEDASGSEREDDEAVTDEDGDFEMERHATTSKSRSASPANSTRSSRRILKPTSRRSRTSAPEPATEPVPVNRNDQRSFLGKLASFVFAPVQFGFGGAAASSSAPQRSAASNPKISTHPHLDEPSKIQHFSRRRNSHWFGAPYSLAHHKGMQQIYAHVQDYPDTYPLDSAGVAAQWRGQVVAVQGWKKRLADWELAAVDIFMKCLEWDADKDDSFWSPLFGTFPIIHEDAIRLAVSVWAKQVMYEDVDLRGEIAGRWDPELLHTRARVLEKQQRWKEEQGIVDRPAPWFSLSNWLNG